MLIRAASLLPGKERDKFACLPLAEAGGCAAALSAVAPATLAGRMILAGMAERQPGQKAVVKVNLAAPAPGCEQAGAVVYTRPVPVCIALGIVVRGIALFWLLPVGYAVPSLMILLIHLSHEIHPYIHYTEDANISFYRDGRISEQGGQGQALPLPSMMRDTMVGTMLLSSWHVYANPGTFS